jgi:adenosylcobyric acid synthase
MTQKYKNIMFVGTGSDVGKSVINAAFCRIFKQDGLNPAPFKAQNMSLNSFPTADGLEIGRAQAVQAEACSIKALVEMNPVLLKPTSYMNSQIVLHGKPWANKSAKEYFNGTDRDFLFAESMKAFSKLEEKYNPIVVEGAGSISEVNLWDRDITNMRVALNKNTDTYLIADIDRGGVFGSVYGTLMLLPEDERKLIKGIIINKFRGDASLFDDGRKKLEELSGVPVVALIPHFIDIYIDDEDSVVVDKKQFHAVSGKTNIAVVLLRHMSNFTDFNMLEQLQGVNLYYAATPEDLSEADIVILPGSKNTISDMLYLRKKGMASAIKEAHKLGKSVYGVCGGYQMMGTEIRDPYHIEGDVEWVPGLGLLPVRTIMTPKKTTSQCRFEFGAKKLKGVGYEIHMGETVAEMESPTCHILETVADDGFFLDSKTWGTYIHGIFDNADIVNSILAENEKEETATVDFFAFKNQQYDKLANLVRQHTDMKYIYNSLKL